MRKNAIKAKQKDLGKFADLAAQRQTLAQWSTTVQEAAQQHRVAQQQHRVATKQLTSQAKKLRSGASQLGRAQEDLGRARPALWEQQSSTPAEEQHETKIWPKVNWPAPLGLPAPKALLGRTAKWREVKQEFERRKEERAKATRKKAGAQSDHVAWAFLVRHEAKVASQRIQHARRGVAQASTKILGVRDTLANVTSQLDKTRDSIV